MALERQQRLVPALPLEVNVAVTFEGAHFRPRRPAVRSQTLSGGRDKEAVVARPAHVEAAGGPLHNAEASGLVHENKWGIWKETQHGQKKAEQKQRRATISCFLLILLLV